MDVKKVSHLSIFRNLAKSIQKSKGILEDGVFYLINNSPLLEPYTFWWTFESVFLKDLEYSVGRFTNKNKPNLTCVGIAVERAASELARKVITKEVGLTFDQLVSFVKTYEYYVGELTDKLDCLDFGKSDDGRGDLMDSLPLAGQSIIENVLAGKFSDDHLSLSTSQPLEKFIKQKLPRWLSTAILDGENYVRMMLRDAVVKYIHLS